MFLFIHLYWWVFGLSVHISTTGWCKTAFWKLERKRGSEKTELQSWVQYVNPYKFKEQSLAITTTEMSGPVRLHFWFSFALIWGKLKIEATTECKLRQNYFKTFSCCHTCCVLALYSMNSSYLKDDLHHITEIVSDHKLETETGLISAPTLKVKRASLRDATGEPLLVIIFFLCMNVQRTVDLVWVKIFKRFLKLTLLYYTHCSYKTKSASSMASLKCYVQTGSINSIFFLPHLDCIQIDNW